MRRAGRRVGRGVLTGAVLGVLVAGCQAVDPIPPAPVATSTVRSATPAAEATPAGGAATGGATAGLNDPAALEARIKQLVAELEAARRAGAEVPRVSEPAPAAARFDEPRVEEPPAVLAAGRDEPVAPPDSPPVAAHPAQTTAPGAPAVRIEVGGPAVESGTVAAGGGTVGMNQAVSVESRGPVPTAAVGDLGGVSVAGSGGGGVEAAVAGRVERDPRDVSAQLDAAILAYLREEPSPNAAAIAGLPQEDREIISAAVDALVNFRAGVRTDPNLMYSARVRPFAELSDRLRLRSELAVPVVAMTSRVDSYGVYEPMPQVISTRTETVTVLYTEVANFTSRLTETRMWETRLSAELGLFDASGRQVWSYKPPLKVDLCRNRRTDFFVSSLVRIPPQPAGRYVLKATVRDENVGRVAEGLLALESK